MIPLLALLTLAVDLDDPPDSAPAPASAAASATWWSDASPTISGPHSAELVGLGFAQLDRPVRACYDALRKSPVTAEGAVQARFTVQPDGQVTGMSLSSEQIPVPWFRDCLRDATLRMKLPEAAGPTVVDWTLLFTDATAYTAIGGLIGAKGTQIGSGGLGARGSGVSDGGGPSDPIILGALDKNLIDAVIKRNMNKIRYCYQKALTKNPTLSGKITEKFVIAKDGSVSKAETKATTMNNPEVESCISAAFMRFSFPEPAGGGIVIVSYPFIFEPG